MKLLLITLLLFSTSTFALENKTYRAAKMKFININEGAKLVTLCGFLDDATLKTDCVAELKKMDDKRMLEVIRVAHTDHTRDKAEKELGCKLKVEKILTAANQPFNGTETCIQLKAALAAYRETKCINRYTTLLTEAEQTPQGSTCSELSLEWSTYQRSIE